jgi:hypothetical protein
MCVNQPQTFSLVRFKASLWVRFLCGWLVGKADNERSLSSAALFRFFVDCTLNPLFATEILFCGLNRNVTEQKLDLLQLASGCVAKPCTGSAEIVGR